jgi:hypothetical protein
MDNPEIYEVLKNFEIDLEKCLKVFGVYVIARPKDIINRLEEIEKAVPQEILKVQMQLIRNGHGYVFKAIGDIKNLVEKSFQIIPNTVICLNKNELLEIIDNIYANLPVDVQEAKILLKS